jgi:hypothetical protein
LIFYFDFTYPHGLIRNTSSNSWSICERSSSVMSPLTRSKCLTGQCTCGIWRVTSPISQSPWLVLV